MYYGGDQVYIWRIVCLVLNCLKFVRFQSYVLRTVYAIECLTEIVI